MSGSYKLEFAAGQRKRGPKRRSNKPPRNPEHIDWEKISRLREVIDGGKFEFDVGDFVDSMLRDSPLREN